jgi:hypothetical protein
MEKSTVGEGVRRMRSPSDLTRHVGGPGVRWGTWGAIAPQQFLQWLPRRGKVAVTSLLNVRRNSAALPSTPPPPTAAWSGARQQSGDGQMVTPHPT